MAFFRESFAIGMRVLRDQLRWKRAVWLLPFLLTPLFVAAVETIHPASSKASGTAENLVALEDPLSFIAERSPGERTGAQLSTKLALAAPTERVLSGERDRDPGAGAAPAADNPVFGLAPGVPGNAGIPGEGVIPGGNGGDPGGGEPFIDGPLAGPTPGQPLLAPSGVAPTSTFVAAVPEPDTWAMLIIGFFAIGAMVRRRRYLSRNIAQRRFESTIHHN